MELPLFLLAILGFIAALRQAFRAAVRLMQRGAEAFFAREMAETRARRGDVTGMDEASGTAARARRARRRAFLELVFWVALLTLPAVLLASPAPVYAAYLIVWFFPRLSDDSGTQPARRRS